MERYLIIDIDVEAGIKEILAREFKLIILDAEVMTNDLLAWRDWGHLEPRSTIIVLPGNGASIVKKYIDKAEPSWLNQWPWKFFPCAKRVWKPGENPQTFVSRIAPTQMLLGAKSVVVIDDVISSGATIRHLRRINEPWIPGANWEALTWVKQESATTKGFSMVFAAKMVGLKERRVPINSLSTLIECPEIAESYARRNFGNEAKDFEKILENLR